MDCRQANRNVRHPLADLSPPTSDLRNMIRPTLPADSPTLIELAAATGVFKPHEIRALGEVLDDYHAANQAQGHRAITFEQSGQILGFAYYAPAAMTDRSWYLYWIAVNNNTQARAICGKLS